MAGSSEGDKPIVGYLKKIIGAPVGEMIPLFEKDVKIGRTKECDVRIRDPNVSRGHCTLHYSSSGWSIKDLGGINGTYLDVCKLVPQVPYALTDNMGIYLGPPSDAPVAFIFMKNRLTEAVSNEAKENLQSKSISPQKDNSPELQSTQSNLKKRSNPTNRSSQSKKHAPSTSPEPIPSTSRDQPSTSSTSLQQPTISSTSNGSESVSSPVKSRRPLLSSDSDDCSDVSICSLDSLRTRIRKMNSHKKKKQRPNGRDCSSVPSNDRDCLSVPSTSTASPSLRRNFEPKPSTSSELQVLKTSKKPRTFEGLRGMKRTNPGVFRELDSLFNDGSGSLTDSVNGREDSESLLRSGTLFEENADHVLVQQRLENDLDQETIINNQKTAVSEKLARKEKMKEQIKMAKALLKEKQEEKKQLEIEATSKKETSEKLGEMLEEELICNICTEVFIKATTLGCSHTFCEHCIMTWKKKQKRCPICREVITSQTRVLIMDNFIDKVVEKLGKAYQDNRKEVIAAREAEKANEKIKKPKKKKAARSRNSRRSGGIVSLLAAGSSRHVNMSQISPTMRRRMRFERIRELGLQALEGSDSDLEEICFICGEQGHDSSNCPMW